MQVTTCLRCGGVMDPSPPWICKFCGTPHAGAATDEFGRPRIQFTDDGVLGFLRSRVAGVENTSLHPAIPPKKLAGVRKSHPYLPPHETILAVYDATVFGSASDGYYVTARRIGFKNQLESANFLEWAHVDPSNVYADEKNLFIGQAKIEALYPDDSEAGEIWAETIEILAYSARPPGAAPVAFNAPESGPSPMQQAAGSAISGPGWEGSSSRWPAQPGRYRNDSTEQLQAPPYQVDTGCSHVDVSPNGGMIAAAGDETIVLYHPNGSPYLQMRAPDSILSMRFSPDGNFLLVGCTNSCACLFDVRTGALRGQTPAMGDYCDEVLWLGQGPRFAMGSQRGEVWIVDGLSMQPAVRVLVQDPEHESLGGMAVLPDGSALFVSVGNRIGAFDTSTGRLHWRFDEALENPSRLAVSPRGDVLVAVGHDGIAMFDARTGQPGARCPMPGVTTVTWPDKQGGMFSRVKPEDMSNYSWSARPRFSPLGDMVACQDLAGNLLFIEVATFGVHATPRVTGRAWIEDLAWFPDGNHLVLGSSDNTLAMWRVRPAQGLLHIRAIPG
ncbi:MAG: PQQ-binding-like beta-propeller repeat protein [Polyangiaceae bacterium]|nr:PQQ-binding-like beta-propeller repeat protein [Polyangiaceae bacterium]